MHPPQPVLFALLMLAWPLLSAGCQHYGPRSIVEDRIPYNHAIASSWKEQTLLNIVRMRYLDTPFFVDIPQITSGYTLQGGGGANGGIFPPVSPDASFEQQLGATLSVQGAYQDRPTISYSPQTGPQFIRTLTSPINPGSVMFLIQSGYPADIVLHLTVESINGVRNRSAVGGTLRPADPEFSRIAQTLRRAQESGHVSIRVSRKADGKDAIAMVFRDKEVSPQLAEDLQEVRRATKLDLTKQEFDIVFGATSENSGEIAILSRSVIRILSELATYVEVPLEHLEAGIAHPIDDVAPNPEPPLRVLSGCDRPENAYAAVCYEGRWFWIDKRDFASKRTMAYLLVLLALADTGPKENLPVITIQAN